MSGEINTGETITMPADSVFVALDIGGTKSLAAAFDPSGKLLRRERADTPRALQESLALLKSLVRSVAADAPIRAIGASAGGPLDYATGIVSGLHYPEWENVPLQQVMEEAFSVPFRVDVDTNVAALAEYRFGGNRTDRLLYVTVSTGVGGGLIEDGRIYRGGNGAHPEVGHQAIAYRLPIPGPIECPCGAVDCLEAVISGSAVRAIYGKQAEQLTAPEWDEVAYNLGQGLRNMAAIYAPSVIVLGGGMALGGGERLLAGAQAVLKRNLHIVPCPEVVFSRLGYDTALWGGLALAMDAARTA